MPETAQQTELLWPASLELDLKTVLESHRADILCGMSCQQLAEILDHKLNQIAWLNLKVKE